MKKNRKIIKLVIIVAVVSFLLSVLIHNGYWKRLIGSIKSVKWYYHVLLIFVNFFLVILVHELGHLFSFVYNKIKIKALFVLIFILKKDKKWKLQIKLANIKLIGGLVVPLLPEITNDQEYESVKSKFSKALIMGPITSIVYCVIVAVFFISFWFFTTKLSLIGVFFTSFIITLLMTLLVHASSKINTNNIYGDYVAYNKFKEEKFSLLQIVQYANFNNEDKPEEDIYLFKRLDEYLYRTNLSYDLFDLGIVSYYLSYFLSLKIKANISMEKVLNYYNITRLASRKDGLEVAYLISSAYYKQGNVDKAYKIFNKIQNISNKHVGEIQQQLLKLEYEHKLNIKDNNIELISSKELYKKEYDLLEPIIDIEEELKKITNKLPFKVYKTDVFCYINDDNLL